MSHPRTVVLQGSQLTDARQRLLDSQDPVLQAAKECLITQAKKWLQEVPWSVMAKKRTPPSGDMHDYTSQAPYWWPSPTPDGSPYVERDGQKNPEVLNYTDRVYVEKVFLSSYTLALAWFYTGDEAYSQHAANIIRTWFITPGTRMNPNLNHAQLIPFANTGRHIGIIDFSQWYTSVLDAAAILATGTSSGGPAPGWTTQDMSGFREWNKDFLGWLVNSRFGQQEHAEKNNHGAFAAMLVAAIALFVGDLQQVKSEADWVQKYIDETIEPDGSLPGELRRTRSWHYSTFTLLALTRLALVAQKVGVDLWAYKGPKGQGITKAIEYLIPAATRSAPWHHPELQFKAYAAADIVRAAATAGHQASREVIHELGTPPEGDLWQLRPAPEQLDPVKTNKDSTP
ncbi:chondroitin AC/alginate lyase [Coniochaeta ligniaria NRRL 30616]|uniref:Chondroitin AC/alginate lyase n=1 Tax=Coniochaeta ligniaria NRRL 30616 TaxID=1408157 RepID=A0A1J7JS36_9PEZI|nr:chondroitin AC/alginate lyase [Coniochaeta ligniaria NRRL 30616]